MSSETLGGDVQGGADEALQEWAVSRVQCGALASVMDVDVRAGTNAEMCGDGSEVMGRCRLDVENRQ